MCQLTVLLERDDGEPEVVMENVSLVNDTGTGVEVSAMFDKPTLITSVKIKKIDMLTTKVTLTPL